PKTAPDGIHAWPTSSPGVGLPHVSDSGLTQRFDVPTNPVVRVNLATPHLEIRDARRRMGPVTNLSQTPSPSPPPSLFLLLPPSSLWGLSGEEIEKAKRGRGGIEGEAWIYVVWFLRFIVSRCQKCRSFRSASLRLLCHRRYHLLALSLLPPLRPLPSPHATEARGIQEDGFDAIFKVRSHLAFCFLDMMETHDDRRFFGCFACRVGFGVKYLGFQHIDLCIFLFIFLRGALT
ncbi:hypothetical protein B296_00055689, partial [Ensete ventricosum]